MTGRERPVDEVVADRDRRLRVRVRDGVGLVLFLVVGAVVVVGLFGGARWAARESAPLLYDLPGGSWGVGGVLGLVTLLGWGGAVSGRLEMPTANGSGKASGAVLRRLARGVCAAAPVAPVLFLISGLQGKNCRTYEPDCSYVPGTGPALLVYAGCVAVVGWLTHRRRRAVLEARRAHGRQRLRKLRTRGRGKSRAARR
ncbi:hypothetical protein [Streptomyces violaceorubidus]|uniref:hypothetical protein n=1 Tax=Streptomyces violaceorubidus TaxID=284042 RepID=UPI0004C0A576|nr:hypothetical protein [Streptomyces violaceorubidus]